MYSVDKVRRAYVTTLSAIWSINDDRVALLTV